MYNLAIREGLPKIGDTPDHIGPNAYYLEEDKYWRKNVVPFLSTTERKTAFTHEDLNENFHWKDVTEHVKGGNSIRNRAIRFIYKQVDTPGPADYDPKIPSKKQSLSERIRPVARGKLYVCEFPRNDFVKGPSVPTRRDENGYALDKNGKLVKLPPDEHDTSLGPAFYHVPTTEPCLNTRKYKGCEWSKRRCKRSTIKVFSNPGPGAYVLESAIGKIDSRYEHVREMARLLSYVPRSLEANEARIRKENLPGPGHYNLESSSLQLTKWTGIKPPPLVTSAQRFCSTEKETPSPDTYLLGSFGISKHFSLTQSGFGVNADRFRKSKEDCGPGPASCNIQWGTISEKFDKKSTFYVTAYAPFNITAPRKFTYINNDYFKPSPAEYLVEPLEREKYSGKGCNFMSKTNRFRTTTNSDCVDPTAYDVSEAFNKSRDPTSHNHQEMSFQSRGERRLFPRKFDTPGPGEYMRHVDFGKNNLAFTRSPRFKNPREDFPGPTSYTISKSLSDSMYKAIGTHNLRLKENVIRTKLRLPPGKTWETWHKTLRKKRKLKCFEADVKRQGNSLDYTST